MDSKLSITIHLERSTIRDIHLNCAGSEKLMTAIQSINFFWIHAPSLQVSADGMKSVAILLNEFHRVLYRLHRTKIYIKDRLKLMEY